ncbi:MAG TPA: serine/threonine-protein kinase [Pyrinomonadaceae bacterium]|nr:serine/threonine-protein kinase [Pyrinomonadaceae bacterium]
MTGNTLTENGRSSLSRGTVLQGRYRIVNRIGNGGMGAVFEAVDLRLGHTVALKQTLTENEELWRQFEREARLLAQLSHPVLPRVSDYFTEGSRAFFVMQFVEGSSLAEMMARQPGPLPQRSVVAWADQLLDALIYLHSHERQIIHRDIKPHNLKVTPAGKIALLDFGLAKSQEVGVTPAELGNSIFGFSPRYAPLEQIQDLGTTPQSDIYALGATLYHLLTGVRPPDALARASALVSAQPNPLKPAHEINNSIGPELSAVLSRAMEQNPHQRYRSAKEFREALRQVGRIEDGQGAGAATQNPANYSLADSDDTTVIAARHRRTVFRPGTRTTMALFVILLTAFVVFCRYYPWKLPLPDQLNEGSIGVSSDRESGKSVRRQRPIH